MRSTHPSRALDVSNCLRSGWIDASPARSLVCGAAVIGSIGIRSKAGGVSAVPAITARWHWIDVEAGPPTPRHNTTHPHPHTPRPTTHARTESHNGPGGRSLPPARQRCTWTVRRLVFVCKGADVGTLDRSIDSAGVGGRPGQSIDDRLNPTRPPDPPHHHHHTQSVDVEALFQEVFDAKNGKTENDFMATVKSLEAWCVSACMTCIHLPARHSSPLDCPTD